MKEEIRGILSDTGAVAVGFARAERVSLEAENNFDEWLASGSHAGMEYMANHRELRLDPRTLLEGTRTVISLAYSFAPQSFRDPSKGIIACYAYFRDYHDVLRKLLKKTVKELEEKYGGSYRICIDSAPVMERYWAVKSGIGKRGWNGSVIVPQAGSLCFLAEILTTLEIAPDQPQGEKCLECGACKKGCPGHAIGENGTIDSRRCISYLTIEHRGEWTSPEALETMSTPIGRNTIFGCDHCLRVCPHNHAAVPISTTATLSPIPTIPSILTISRSDIARMTEEDFAKTFQGSPIRRAKLSGLLRNIGL